MFAPHLAPHCIKIRTVIRRLLIASTTTRRRILAAASSMPHEFLGTSWRRWLEYLVAILVGNAIYFFSLEPHLPKSFHHQGFRVDLGSALDLAVCAGVYGLMRLRPKN